MTETPDGGTGDIAEDSTQGDAVADGGGGSSYGPSGSVGGEQEPGGPVPPSEGRTKDVPVKTDGSDYRDDPGVGPAHESGTKRAEDYGD